MLNKLTAAVAVAGLTMLASPTRATAGTIYINDATFLANVAGLQLLFTQNFDSFAIAPVVSPLAIAGGLASISNATNITNLGDDIGPDTEPPSADDKSLRQAATVGPALSFSIPGGVQALGFYFQARDSGTWTLGPNVSGVFAGVTPTAPNIHFVGWIGNPGESLFSASFSNSGGLRLDDVTAYRAVPEPATLLLFGSGLAAAGAKRYRQRKKK